MLISEKTIREELPDLKFDYLLEKERNVTEGIKHTGVAAVTQAIGVLK